MSLQTSEHGDGMNKAQRIERIGMIVRSRENGLVSTVVLLI
jgi:hypothetical protein